MRIELEVKQSVRQYGARISIPDVRSISGVERKKVLAAALLRPDPLVRNFGVSQL